MFIGAVKWFNNTKGFGVLSLSEDTDLFVHIRGFRNPVPESIQPHHVIIGEKQWDAVQKKELANDCRLLAEPDDWRFVVSLLDAGTTVYLANKQGRYRKWDLMALAASQLLAGKDIETIYRMAISVSRMLEPQCFIPYAQFLHQAFQRFLDKEISAPVLLRIFNYFGTQIDAATLFAVWKEAHFQYIGYHDPGDYEIPEEVFNLHATEIGYDELCRIRAYSFGETFCAEFTQALLDDVDSMDRQERDRMIPYLDFLAADERAYWARMLG